jgi:uncharacterized lipoprotein YehR (DUF1307 family)
MKHEHKFYALVMIFSLMGCAQKSYQYFEGKFLEGNPKEKLWFVLTGPNSVNKGKPNDPDTSNSILIKMRYGNHSKDHLLRVYKNGKLLKECTDIRPVLYSSIVENGYNPERTVVPRTGDDYQDMYNRNPYFSDEATDKKFEDYKMAFEINCRVENQMDTLYVNSCDSKGIVSKYLIAPSLTLSENGL